MLVLSASSACIREGNSSLLMFWTGFGWNLSGWKSHDIGAWRGVEWPEGFCFPFEDSPGVQVCCGFMLTEGTRDSWAWTKAELQCILLLLVHPS